MLMMEFLAQQEREYNRQQRRKQIKHFGNACLMSLPYIVSLILWGWVISLIIG